MIIRLLFFLLLFSASSGVAQPTPLFFDSAPFSFHIGAPLTWKLLPATFPTEKYELQNKDLFNLVKEEHSIPIIRIVKPVPGNTTISPAVQVFVESSEGQTPIEFLSTTIESAAVGYKMFQIVQQPTDTSLNNIKAAYMESSFITKYSGDRQFNTLSKLWAIPRDKMMFVISISGQPDDLRAVDGEVKMILSTISFKNK